MGNCEGSLFGLHVIDAHRLRNVLQLLQTEVLESSGNLPGDLVVDLARNTDPTRLGNALQTRGDVHPIAVDSGFIMDDIALIDTDPESHSARLVDVGVALCH